MIRPGFRSIYRGPMHHFCPPRADSIRCRAGFDGFSSSSDAAPAVREYTVSIMGDLHLAHEQMHLFDQARAQLVHAMSGEAGQLLPGARIIQLGDLGHDQYGSGGTTCFAFAKAYLDGFGAPTALVLGNHDLEGAEFETDTENLVAWQAAFGQLHYWAAELGPVTAVGLSTTRYRSNISSHHEVFIDDEQLLWLEGQLEQHKGRPVVIFTHAPPIGCGLKVLQSVHIKNRCAWLNHSDRPERFIDLVGRHPNIRLWFSGHFHLSHNYSDSISVVGQTAFVQTGVIGESNRDGYRHSRVLKVGPGGYQVLTLDHVSGALRLDLKAEWLASEAPRPLLPPTGELLCSSPAGVSFGQSTEFVQWFPVGGRSILALQEGLLVEYDVSTSAPIGLVSKVPEGCKIRLLALSGEQATAADGSDVVSIEVVYLNADPRVFSLNAEGRFFRIFQPNKWQAKKRAAEETDIA